MISEAVRRQIHGGEGPNTEFIATSDEYPSISRAVCAFLNGSGGSVLCGVDDCGRVVGLEGDVEAIRKALETKLNEDLSPSTPFTTAIEYDGGSAIIAIEVPAGLDPPYLMSGSAYLRSGASSQPASASQLRAMIQKSSAMPERWERRPAAGLEIEDLSHEEIRALVVDAHSSGRFSFRDPDDDLAVLGQLGMAGSLGFTQGADVAFGQNPARRHPQLRVRVMKFSTDRTGESYDTDVWFEGPIINVFNQCVTAVEANVRLQSRFQPGELRRKDQPEYSLHALREGIVNALAHRDYSSFSGGVIISIYPGRIDIWNSGRLPEELSTKDLRGNHPSIPTNPDIVHVLYLRRLMERTGRGTQMIVQECKLLGAQSPKWQDKSSGVTLTLYASSGNKEAHSPLNERQELLLASLSEGESIAPARYREKFAQGLSTRHARRDLTDLVDWGFVARSGAGASTRYLRTNKPWPR